jgi:hypothetical protein
MKSPRAAGHTPLAMPAEQGRWLHNDESLSPVEPTAEPREGETGGCDGTPRCDVALLIER